MKIFIWIFLLFPLLIQAKINPYIKECKALYSKEYYDMSAIKDVCTQVAKYEEKIEG